MIQLFFIALLTISVLSGLTVEAIKKMFKDYKVSWHANILSAVVSTVLSIAVSAGYIVYTGTFPNISKQMGVKMEKTVFGPRQQK